VREVWSQLGLRARLALSIAAIVLAAFAAVFVAVRIELRDEQGPVQREAQAEVEQTVLIAGGIALGVALLAGYLLAARAAAPLRGMAATAAAVDAGDLTPRIGPLRGAPVEARTLAAAFDHMLDRLDEAFSSQRRFVSDASHELRTPLTAIRGQLEVLAAKPDPDPAEVRQVERVVLAEMARIERLVEDLLLLARLEEDAQLRLAAIALPSFLEQIAADRSLGGVELAEPASGTLRGDPEALTQVLRNLIGNARRHAGPAGRVSLAAFARGSRLTICVDDDGPGIDPAERERIFDRFHRSEAARDRRSGGAGLGLAIARSIVERHGGRIWAEDSPLGGARVAFELRSWTGFESAGPAGTQLGNA
jgi:two-component system OmpR family sensor kinase